MKNYGRIEHSLDGTTKEWVESLFGTVSEPEDGITPHIGGNGNWYIGEVDTGVSAQGEPGEPGEKGEPGDSITITESVTTGDGDVQVTFSDDSVIIIPRGLPGEQGEPGEPGQDGKDGVAGEVVEYDIPVDFRFQHGVKGVGDNVKVKRIGDSIFIKGKVFTDSLGANGFYRGIWGNISLYNKPDHPNLPITGAFPELAGAEVVGVSSSAVNLMSRGGATRPKNTAEVDAFISEVPMGGGGSAGHLNISFYSEVEYDDHEFFAEIKLKFND